MEFAQLVENYRKFKYFNAEECERIIEEMRSLADREEDTFLLGKYYSYYADWVYHNRQLDEGYEKALKGISILLNYPSCKELGYCYNVLGGVCGARGEKLQALDCYLDGANHALGIGDPEVLCTFYNNIGLLCITLEDYDRSAEFLQMAYRILKEIEGRTDISIYMFIVCMNLCAVCIQHKKIKEAENYLSEARTHYMRKGRGRRSEFDLKITECSLFEAQGRMEESNASFDELIDIMKTEKIGIHMFRMIIHLMESRIRTESKEKLVYVLSALEGAVKTYQNTGYELEVCSLWCKFFERFEEREHYSLATEYYYHLSMKREKEVGKMMIEAADMKFKLVQLSRKHELVMAETARLQKRILQDSLTGLYNRSAMGEVFEDKFEEVKKRSDSICVAIMDVDCFKSYNDTYGHLYGDRCLRYIGNLLHEMSDEDTLFMRYGGDEFLALFCGKTKEEVDASLREIQEKIKTFFTRSECTEESLEEGRDGRNVTVTQGAYYAGLKENDTLGEYIRYADRALYRGKKQRDTIVLQVE